MNAQSFIKAKGQKVYEVTPWNFIRYLHDLEWVINKTNDAPNEITITELTVMTAGKKEVKFLDFTGNYSGLCLWHGRSSERIHTNFFLSMEDALDYVKVEYADLLPSLLITKRHAKLCNWISWQSDVSVPVIL